MYAYFLPAKQQGQINKRKHDRLRFRLKTSRISGEFYEYHNRAELAQYVAKNTTIGGTKNFVSIGGDDDFHDLLNAVANLSQVTFGFIPDTKASQIAHHLGIDNPRQAYGVLSHRKIRTMPVLQLNQTLVLSQTQFDFDAANFEIKITIDASLEIEARVSRIEIINNLFEEPATKPIVLNLYHHLEAAGDKHQQPIIKLDHAIHNAHKAHQQIAHLQASQIEIQAKSPFQNQLLTTPITHLIIKPADHTIAVINKKHNDLSSDGQ